MTTSASLSSRLLAAVTAFALSFVMLNSTVTVPADSSATVASAYVSALA